MPPVGRERELGEIVGFLERVGGLPNVLRIRGEPGIGKTTLCRNVLELAAERGSRAELGRR